MVDARLKGEWLTAPAHDRLSDPAYRVLHNALMFANEQGTDGLIEERALRYLYPGPIADEWLEELVAAGFWFRDDSGSYQLIGWTTTLGQSTAADVEYQRERSRRKQRAYRDRVRAAEHVALAAENASAQAHTGARPSRPPRAARVTGHDPGYVTGVVGQDRTGPERTSPVLSSERARPSGARGHDCSTDGHKLVADGTCAVCEYRPEVAS